MRCIVAAFILGVAAPPAIAQLPAAEAALIERGRSIYFGTHESVTRPGAARVQDAPVPAASAACVACHRPSGLGSSESRLQVPPIAGFMLFNPLLPQTGRRLPWPSRDRTRPAYDEATLLRALNEGIAPDGVPLAAPMPRYALDPSDVAALAAYLRTLSGTVPPGVSDEEVVFATVTTPDVPTSQVDDLLHTLRAFFNEKNAGTRRESGRRSQAHRTESTMYSRFRRWRLEHWALEGEPETWGAQLDTRYRAAPVFALISGISYDDWGPVHTFCERARVPCLLPNVWMPPAREDFYNVYFSQGLASEASALAQSLNGTREVVLWTESSGTGERQRAAIEAAFGAQGIRAAARNPRADDIVVTALPSSQVEARYRALPHPPRRVYVLGGALGELPDEWTPEQEGLRLRAVLVTPLGYGEQSERQLARTRAWLNKRKMQPDSGKIASNALLAAVLTVETLTHIDERFSREYCIEKIEHNLENIPPLTAYPRLSIGPSQRFAAKTVHLLPLAHRSDALADRVRLSRD
jgi:mono/diheme cytochrome c family protein